MRYKDILLHCGPVPGADSRLAVALDLARRHEAHLTAVFVHDIPDSVFFGDAGFGSATAMLDVMEKVRADLAAAEGAQRAAFDDALRANGLRGDWRSAEGRTGQLLALMKSRGASAEERNSRVAP